MSRPPVRVLSEEMPADDRWRNVRDLQRKRLHALQSLLLD